MQADTRNLILAIALSLIILLGFQYFIAPPLPDPSEVRTEQVDPESAGIAASDGVPDTSEEAAGLGLSTLDTGSLAGGAVTSREEAIDATPRVLIDTARVDDEGRERGIHGSISLVGGAIDDLTLAGYRETVDPDSPEIVLLSPRNTANPYFIDMGWVNAADSSLLTVSDTEWTADRDQIGADEPVTLTHTLENGLTLERVISVDENYMFTVTQRVVNTTDAPITVTPYARVRRIGTPDVLGYFILHEGPYGVFDETLEEYDYADIEDADDGLVEFETTGGWLGFTDKYWLVAIIPDQEQSIQARFQHVVNGDQYFATYSADTVTIPPGGTAENTNRVFAGAKEVELIDFYEEEYGINNFDLTIDFGWFYFLTKPFFYGLAYINAIVGNFGVAILIFTVFIKLLFFPLANKSYKAMSKMKALQPEMMKIRERFGEDRQKMNMEMMGLYKREKVNPASGCLPILIQIPVFFALYKVLFVTIEMRHAPFFGWIQDLSVPDPTSLFNLFGLLPYDVPAILMIGVWPLIMGVTMFLQQKVNPAPADPLQQKIFMMLPVVFTIFLASFPAGLVIYWAWNNALSILQQVVIMKRMGVKIGGGREPAPALSLGGSTAKPKAEEAEAPSNGGNGRKASKKAVWSQSGDNEGDAPREITAPSAPRRRKGQSRGGQRPKSGGQRRR